MRVICVRVRAMTRYLSLMCVVFLSTFGTWCAWPFREPTGHLKMGPISSTSTSACSEGSTYRVPPRVLHVRAKGCLCRYRQSQKIDVYADSALTPAFIRQSCSRSLEPSQAAVHPIVATAGLHAHKPSLYSRLRFLSTALCASN